MYRILDDHEIILDTDQVQVARIFYERNDYDYDKPYPYISWHPATSSVVTVQNSSRPVVGLQVCQLQRRYLCEVRREIPE